MKCFDGRDSLELEREGRVLRVFLDAAQAHDDVDEFITDEVVLESDVPEGYKRAIRCEISEHAVSLAVTISNTSSRLERLRLAQKIGLLLPSGQVSKVPFLHPENIFVDGDRLFVAHFGLRRLIAPMGSSDAHVLRVYKTLILAIFTPEILFEQLLTGATVLEDEFSRRVLSFESVGELSEFIDDQSALETRNTAKRLVFVSNRRYRFYQVVAVCAVLACLVVGAMICVYSSGSAKREAIISAQNYYMVQDYSDTLAALKDYPPNQLPKPTRYVLAVASVSLSDLTASQRQTVLANLSAKSDDNTLDYWIFIGRSDFSKALDLAQNIGDDQLTLLAYTDLYASVKQDSTMNGAKKQQLLDDYTKKIQDLSKSLEQ